MSWTTKIDLAALALVVKVFNYFKRYRSAQGRHHTNGISTAQHIRTLQAAR